MKLNRKPLLYFIKTLFFVAVLLVVAACSRKKDKWLNRNFHAMGTYYNILYHGNLAFEQGEKEIKRNYEDNYWEVLPIERMAPKEDETVYGKMIEVPEAVMPTRRNLSPKKEDKKGSFTQQSGDRKIKEAFENFQQNRGYNQGQQGMDPNQGGFNSNQPNYPGRNGMNPNQGGFNPNQGMNPNQGGFNPNQGMNPNQGGFNSGQTGMPGGAPRGGMRQTGMNSTMPGNRQSNNQAGPRGGGSGMMGGNQLGRDSQRSNTPMGSNMNAGGGLAAPTHPEWDMSLEEAFDAAEEKAVKAVQKHNMLIKGEEHNPQMKNAFLLLGKSRYFQERYFPALEAFNYIITKYDDQKIKASAELWKEKTYMRLEQYDRVIANLQDGLKSIQEDPTMSDRDLVRVAKELAKGYFHKKNADEVIVELNMGLAGNSSPKYEQILNTLRNEFNYKSQFEDKDIQNAVIALFENYYGIHNKRLVYSSINFPVQKDKKKNRYEEVRKRLIDVVGIGPHLSADEIAELHATLAQTYLYLDQKDQAINHLESAVKNAKDNEKKGRYLFILGQLQQETNNFKASQKAFNDVIALNRKIPRRYLIQAYMQKAKNFDYVNGDTDAQLDTLENLLKDRENRPYLDVVNYWAGKHFEKLDDMPTAVKYYNQSLRTGLANHQIKHRIYKTLAEYNFDRSKYKQAGAYYDSTMVNIPEASLEYHRLKRRRLSLNDVIMYEEVAAGNDSIIRIIQMPEDARRAYFQNYVDSIQAIAVAQAEKEFKQNKRANLPANMFGSQRNRMGGGTGGSGFYFYNANLLASGKSSFRQVWGDRALQDDWRFEKGKSLSKKEKKEQSKKEYIAAVKADPKFDVETYLSQIPKEEGIVGLLEDERNYANYQLGIIYLEKFHEPKLSIAKLERLLNSRPEEDLVVPAKYNLYKAYKELGENSKTNYWKENILQNHPDSRYAQLIKNPASLKENADNPIQIYNRLYKSYKEGDYQLVINEIEEHPENFLDHATEPKFELLKAVNIGRLEGLDAYEEALEFVRLTYPQSVEGKEAKRLIEEVIPELRKRKFETTVRASFRVVYPIQATDRSTAIDFSEKVKKALEERGDSGYKILVDTYAPNIYLVVVRGLSSEAQAQNLQNRLSNKNIKNTTSFIDHDAFIIDSDNYEVLLMQKKIIEYRTEFD